MVVERYTHELQDILRHVQNDLYKAFPNKFISIEYIIAAFLENKNCHANMLFDKCLTSNNIQELSNIFMTYIQDHANVGLSQFNTPIFSDEVINVFEYAEKKVDKDKLIGSEHILLSILEKENGCTKIINIFKNIGIDYNFMFSMLSKSAEKEPSQRKQKIINEIPKKILFGGNNIINGMTSYIQQYTINLKEQAEDGKIDEVIGRKTEIGKIIEVLARRKKNNVILVGLGGVGKTSIVQHLANLISRNEVPDFLKNKKIVQLNVAALIAGTSLRGAFEERVKGLFDEMKQTNKYILFIDDMHTVLKTSSREKDTDISSMINDILSNGEIKIIGATTFKDYHNAIESNPMIARRLQKIVIEPTNVEDTINILQNIKHYYEEYHNVKYTDEAIKKSVELAKRYITDRSLPDSAIDVLDFSGAHTCLEDNKPKEITDLENNIIQISNEKNEFLNKGDFDSAEKLIPQENELKETLASMVREYNKNIESYKKEINENDIYNAVTELTNIPISQLSSDERKNLSHINDVLKREIIGQDESIDKICKAIKRNRIGIGNPNRVIYSGLITGKSGTGKTLLAKKLAEQIYGDEKALVRIDMSEYSEKSSVSKLIGASAGYIGYDQGGQLTEAIKNKPYCVLLLDEIEKADKEVYNLFLQLFDEGRLTDNSGQIVNFKNVIVLMTSNVGVKRAQDFNGVIGFDNNDNTKHTQSIIEKEIRNRFMPEFLNRLDQIIYFNDLTDQNIKDISKLEFNIVLKRLEKLGYKVNYCDEIFDVIANYCIKQKEYGARPIKRYIQENIEDVITDLILSDDKHEFTIYVENNNIKIV